MGSCHTLKLNVYDTNNTFGADKQGEKEGVKVLELLEGIDDDMDRLGVGMVKISEASAAKYEDDVDKLADVDIMVILPSSSSIGLCTHLIFLF